MGEQYSGSTRIFSLQKMTELLEQGVPLESADKDGKTFLRHACADGKSDIVEFLLETGADPNTRDNEGKTPLMTVSMTGRFNVVELLLRYGADPQIESKSGDSALKIAQRWAKKDIVQALLEKIEGADRGPGLMSSPSLQPTDRATVSAPMKSVASPPTEKPKGPPISCVVEEEGAHAPVKPPSEQVRSEETGKASTDPTISDLPLKDSEPMVYQDNPRLVEVAPQEQGVDIRQKEEDPRDWMNPLRSSLEATGVGANARKGFAAVLGAGRSAVSGMVNVVTGKETEQGSVPLPSPIQDVSSPGTITDVAVRASDLAQEPDGFKIPELSTDEYLQALEKMKQSPKDRIGILGSLGATGLGAAAGAAASGSIAAALGATTLLGSSTLGTVLGGVLVTTTPVGWVVGSAAAAAAIGYGISKLVSSGARADVIKEGNIKELEQEIRERKAAAEKTEVVEDKFKGLVESLQLLVLTNRISQSDCTELIAGVEEGLISYEYAFGTVERLSMEEARIDAQ